MNIRAASQEYYIRQYKQNLPDQSFLSETNLQTSIRDVFEKTSDRYCADNGFSEYDKKAKDGSLVKITVISVNDMHGKLEEMPKLAGVIEALRRNHPDAIVVEGGDSSYNPPYSDQNNNAYKPLPDILNEMDFDYMNLGNHEFQFGKDAAVKDFINKIDKQNTEILGANVHDKSKEDSLPGVKPYSVRNINGIRVAFVGVTEKKMSTGSHPDVGKGLFVEEPEEALRRLMPKIKKEADVVIALSHQGVGDDIRLVKQIKGLDLVLASHDHTPDNVQKGNFPNQTYIVEPHAYCKEVALSEIYVDPVTREVVNMNFHRIPVKKFQCSPDAEVAQIIKDYHDNGEVIPRQAA